MSLPIEGREQDKFEDLSDEEAQTAAWCFGIHTWTDRADLNRQWDKFQKELES
jgi:hypothetical protein